MNLNEVHNKKITLDDVNEFSFIMIIMICMNVVNFFSDDVRQDLVDKGLT